MVGEILKLCGSQVQVSCPDMLASGSLHTKAKSGLLGVGLDKRRHPLNQGQYTKSFPALMS